MAAKPGTRRKRMMTNWTASNTNPYKSTLKIHWPIKVTNEEVRERPRLERISRTQIQTRRWRRSGHVLRMKPDSFIYQELL